MFLIISPLSFMLFRARSSSLFHFSIAGHGVNPLFIPAGSSLFTLQPSHIVLEVQCLEPRKQRSCSSWHFFHFLSVMIPSASFLKPGPYSCVPCPMLVQMSISAKVWYLEFIPIKKPFPDPFRNMWRTFRVVILHPSIFSVPSPLFVISMWNVPIFHSNSWIISE